MAAHARFIAVGLLLACAGADGAGAETEPWNRSGLWRLRPESSIIRGCFDPCECPVMFQDDLRGEFALRLVTIGNVFDFYAVDGMVLRAPTLGWTVAGDGTFRFSQIAGLEEMTATLTLNGQSPEVFDGMAAVPANPDTMDLEIDVHNRVCLDTVLRLVAARCRADWDRSGDVSPADVAAFVAAWHQSLGNNTLDGDFDGSGAINPGDVALMVGTWFSTLSGAPCG